MICRLTAALGALAILSGCTTFSDADAIARVNDSELSVDRLDELVDTFLGPQAAAPVGTGTNANTSRGLITQWVQVEAIEDHLIEIGVDVTDDIRATAGELIDGDPTLADISESLRTYLIDTQAVIDTFNGLPDPQASFDAAMVAADIHVDARYGVYRSDVASVVPLGFGPPTNDL